MVAAFQMLATKSSPQGRRMFPNAWLENSWWCYGTQEHLTPSLWLTVCGNQTWKCPGHRGQGFVAFLLQVGNLECASSTRRDEDFVQCLHSVKNPWTPPGYNSRCQGKYLKWDFRSNPRNLGCAWTYLLSPQQSWQVGSGMVILHAPLLSLPLLLEKLPEVLCSNTA